MGLLKGVCKNAFFACVLFVASYAYSNDIVHEDAAKNGRSKFSDALSKKACKTQEYYLNIAEFIQSFIEIQTANVAVDSTTISSKYLAGRAPVYNRKNEKVGTCSASFLCMQNAQGIYTDISNYLSVDNGLIVSWLTPTTLINLELDSVVHSMITECLVVAYTKIGFNPFYGKTFNMIVSSEQGRIYFNLCELRNVQ